MKYRACLALLTAFCLCLGLLVGCTPQDPVDEESSASSALPESSESALPEDPATSVEESSSLEESLPEESAPESTPEASEPEISVPEISVPEISVPDTPVSTPEPESSFEDSEDITDPYPESSEQEEQPDDGRDWTQPDVPMTDLSADRLATLEKTYNDVTIPAWKEEREGAVTALLIAADPITSHVTVALKSGDVALETKKDVTGWELEAGATDTLYLDLDDATAKAYAGKRVAVYVDYYAPRNSTAMVLTTAAGKTNIKPSVTKVWGRNMVILEDAALEGGADGHDLSLTVTGGSAVVKQIILTTVNAEKEVGDVTLIEPKYDKTRPLLTINTTVQQFGAVGDGKADDTKAFQAAMDYVSSLGGGTVYVPEGHYAISGHLTIPQAVMLVGELDAAEMEKSGKVVGTVLDLYYGKNAEETDYAISLSNGSALMCMALWYPEQQIVDGEAIPYSYTIGGSYVTGGVNYATSMENIVLVNSYNGIKFGPKFNVLQTIRNVWGSPLNNGFIMDANADLARIEGMYFSPDYWANSGMANAPERDWIYNCTYNNAIAYIAERVDWTYIFDVHIDGYQTGFLFRFSTGNGGGASNGSLYGLDIYDCFYGVDISVMNEIGLEFADCRIYSSGTGDAAAIRVHSGTRSTLQLMDCELGSRGKHVIYNYADDVLSFSRCTFSFLNDDPHGAAIYSYKGAVSGTELTFRHVVTDVHLGKEVSSAEFLNCGNMQIRDLSERKVARITTDTTVKCEPIPSIDLNQASNNRPTANMLVDMTGKLLAGENVAEKLQAAMDSLKGKGGIVYLPAGTYNLNSPIVIPAGVELRGAMDAPQYSISPATYLCTNYSKGAEDATALITMEEKSGIVGFCIVHEQNAAAPVAYPYTICGDGSDIYVRNVTMNSCYNGIDFATNRCDRHLVQSFSGVVLNQGIVVGSGSENGVIRDVLVNPVYWAGSGSYNDAMMYALGQADGIVIGDSTGELLYSTFYYAAEKGLVFTEGCKDAVSITHGTDCADIGLYLEGECGNIYLVNYQVASWTGTDVSYVKTAESFTGTLDICGMLGWGGPHIALNLQGGNIRIRQCKLTSYGSRAIDLGNANVQLIGWHLFQTGAVSSPLIPNLVINENAGSLYLAASVFDNEPNLYDYSEGDVVKGSDAEKLVILT